MIRRNTFFLLIFFFITFTSYNFSEQKNNASFIFPIKKIIVENTFIVDSIKLKKKLEFLKNSSLFFLDEKSITSVVDKFDEKGAKVLQFGSIRSKLRKEMTDIYSQQPGEEGGGEERGKCTCCEVGRASGRRPCRIKGSAHSYLAAYNCNVGHKDFGNRAQKQIFKPSYMVYHFVHYNAVTTSSLLPVKDGSSQRFRHPDNEVVTVYDEAVMIHAKGMLPWSAASNHCFGEDEDGKYIEGQLNQCLLGTEWYLDDAGERIRAESGEDVGRGEPRAMRAKR